MPNVPPPAALPGTPTKVTLPEGTALFRVHASALAGTAFNPVPADRLYGGGRFDATEARPYTYLYAGLAPAAAVCESLLRSVPFAADGGPRVLPRTGTVRKRCTFLRLVADVTVVSLMSGADLAAVGQDSWLVQAEAAEYPWTRNWGHWIRDRTEPWAQGFVWPSKREPADRVVILFGDRCAPDTVAESEPAVDFGTADGEDWLNSVLAPYHARVAP
ncbi:RES family NAD+ phosphorylase [Streptomyces sp. SCL15-4]|uniref:RES family NAD+ phosphorylase n=1 Tax=Streptomyces sp. SCL15-4 TaxID=2967221 RepID=UPI00296723BE|nr:RES family NAD+ phosphorylase [Streptomyces sp. SCL15-4]